MSMHSFKPASAEEWVKAIGQKQLPLDPTPAEPGKQSDSTVDKPPVNGREDALKNEEIADRQANRELREKYADKAYQLAHFCLVWWMGMLFFQGGLMATNRIQLWSDKVLVAVTAGVTASVLAAFLGVIRGLFPSDKNGKNGK